MELSPRKPVVCELGERLSAPQAERLGEEAAGARCVRALGLGDQPLEANEVERVGVELDQVSRLPRRDHGTAVEVLAQLRHVKLQRVRGSGRRLRRPERRREAIERHNPVRRQEKDREERALLGPAERDGTAVIDDLERSQDPELQLARVSHTRGAN
jgi:hypothetical protein